jgi:hypothetical protein
MGKVINGRFVMEFGFCTSRRDWWRRVGIRSEYGPSGEESESCGFLTYH